MPHNVAARIACPHVQLVDLISNDYVAALAETSSPAAATPELVIARQARARTIVMDAIASISSTPLATDQSVGTESGVLGVLASGLDTRESLAATVLLFEIALAHLRRALPEVDSGIIAVHLMRRVLDDVASAADVLLPPSHAETTEVVDRDRLQEFLTPREADIFDLVRNRACTRDIAQTLGISENTTKHHVTSIGRKLGTSGRHGVIDRARELGILIALPALSLAPAVIDGIATIGM